jgi:hypothetical protein
VRRDKSLAKLRADTKRFTKVINKVRSPLLLLLLLLLLLRCAVGAVADRL